MIEIKPTDTIKVLYTDPSNKYRLVIFNDDTNNLEVIVYRSASREHPKPKTCEKVLSRKCIGLIENNGKDEKWEILADGSEVQHEISRGRPPRKYSSISELREYWKTLLIDPSEEIDDETISKDGWYRFPCYCTSISSGLFKIVEFGLKDKLPETVSSAKEFRNILDEFKEHIIKHLEN